MGVRDLFSLVDTMIRRLNRRLARGMERFEQFTVDVIYGRRRGRGAKYYAFLLNLLSRVFSVVVQARHLLYKHRIFRNHHLGCLVVVVGNLTVGGTGKTPVVEKFARSLVERGRRVAILSRGYKSKTEPLLKRWWHFILHRKSPPPKVVSDGEQIFLDSEWAGDEPYMLAKNLPGVLVIVDKNRIKAGLFAIKKFGVDTLILDDGFQYLALKEHLHLLLVDKTNPFGNKCLLPRGILREPIKHIRRASHIFLTKSNGQADPELERLIRRYKPDAEIIECRHAPRYLQEVNGSRRLDLSILKQKRIGSFCGIAAPDSFEEFLRKLGAEIRYNRRFVDHHRYERSELEYISNLAEKRGLDMLVTTEKDAVRIPADFNSKISIYYLRVEIEILSGGEDFEDAVSRICFDKKNLPSTRSPFPSNIRKNEIESTKNEQTDTRNQ